MAVSPLPAPGVESLDVELPVDATPAGSGSRPPQLQAQLRRRQTAVKWAVLTPVLAFFFIPLFSMLIFSVRFPLTGKWTGQAWASIFGKTPDGEDLGLLWDGVSQSILLCLFTVALMLLLLVPMMLALKLRPSKLNRIIEFLCLLPLAIPAIVLVVGLAPVYRWMATNGFGTDSIWLGFAYSILVLPYGYRALESGFGAIPVVTMVEAARSLGASWPRVLFTVVLPNLRRAIASACFITVAVVVGEYTIAALLNRNNLQVALYQVGQSDPMVSTGLSLLTLAIGIALLVIVDAVTSRQKGGSA